MKLAIFCIGGLNKAILSKLRVEALDNIAYHDIESTIPSEPLTSWTTAWTGIGPAVHGKVAGIKGRKPALNTIWDDFIRNGQKVIVYDEGEWAKEDDTDIGVYNLDSVSDSVINGDIAQAQETLNSATEMIKSVSDIPYLIISAYGTAKYSTSLNVDKFLIGKSMIKRNARGMEYEETIAYPANYIGKKPRTTYGIVLNSNKRIKGFMEDRHVMNVAGNLMMILNNVQGIDAKPAHLQYDITGSYFDDMPDIVLSSPSNLTCFRVMGEVKAAALSPCYDYGLSAMGMIASNEPDVISGINTVMDIRKAIKRANDKAKD
jgi:hypothetical protein